MHIQLVKILLRCCHSQTWPCLTILFEPNSLNLKTFCFPWMTSTGSWNVQYFVLNIFFYGGRSYYSKTYFKLRKMGWVKTIKVYHIPLWVMKISIGLLQNANRTSTAHSLYIGWTTHKLCNPILDIFRLPPSAHW